MLWLMLGTAYAAFPMQPFPDCDPNDRDTCPNDLRDWSVLSTVPENARNSVRPAELELGAGVHLDRALRYTAGRFDTSLAVLDSGIFWRESQLHNKVMLNLAELPLPQDANGAEIPGGDLDGNGLVNLSDYAEDPRVDITAGADSADDRLDPSDLIHTFSDGIDDDGNGFIDDIAGWDFFDDDNDPWAEFQGANADHGTGVMKEAAAPGDDGGSIGTCPNCALLPIRIGDTFIGNGDHVGMAIAYATDRGVSAIGMAIGGLTQPDHATEAIFYAESQGVVLVGAAGDENSWHHNMPAAIDPILYVHSLRSNTGNEDGAAYSFMNTWNCNNFGPRLDLVSPSNACATGSVAKITGAAALVKSAGRDNGIELSADEVRALLRGTVDDVYLTEEEQDEARSFPSKPGWDVFHGYGRLNVGRAVESVFNGEIPPAARITSPHWFDHHDGELAIEGVATSTTGIATWSVEWGLGAEPDSWTEIGSGDGPIEGELGRMPVPATPAPEPQIPTDDLPGKVRRAHAGMVTLRLTVTDTAGRTSHDRVGFWPLVDPDLAAGFPKQLGSSLESAPLLADLDGDGLFELLAVESGGTVHAWDASGVEMDGFPVQTNVIPAVAAGWNQAKPYVGGVREPREGVVSGPAVGDLDGDGDGEVLIVGLEGSVYAWHHDGTVVDGFPLQIPPVEHGVGLSWERAITAGPVLADLEQDGTLEIIAGGQDQQLYVWDHTGNLLPGYPLFLCSPPYCDGGRGTRILAPPAVGDVDGDGDLEAVVSTGEVPTGDAGVIYVVDLATASLQENPIFRDGLLNEVILPYLGEGHAGGVALADVDLDGDLEIFSNPVLGTNGLIHHDGTEALPLAFVASDYGPRSNMGDGGWYTMATHAAFGDIDGDGAPDPVTGGTGVSWLISLALTRMSDYQHAVGAWSGATGSYLPGFPQQVDDVSFLTAPAIADLSGDGSPDVVYATGGHFAYAWQADGQLVPGWPKLTGGWTLGGASVGDMDGDGRVEVAMANREGTVFVWHTEGRADAVEWPAYRHDPHNTGNYETPLPEQAGPPEVESPNGCCNKSGGEGLLVLMPLLPLWWRRRAA